ncbi:RluA family pseudouridine synthase [Lutibacter aestuarii]|uniref:RluA family pseudouridine synthase n=1 Tax=Lutibacter aestuarii TaxID=861111 RepID=A0ABW2Z1R0_9FLAO|nr:RluA family pseudouridine synthase [uncultured Lutibacter sp.]
MGSTIKNLQILFEDNHLIIVNKQSGDIVQGDKTGDQPLSDIIKEYIKKNYNKPGNVFLGVVHRLDRPTTGVVVFARTSKALERFNKMLRNKEVHKTYWAVVKNKPKNSKDSLTSYLKKNPKNNKSTSYSSEIEGSKKAILHYKVLKSLTNYHLLEVDLETGRHHQIRCQLASIGSPIKGDLKYGFNRSNKDASIHLHARKIEFIHPVSKENISIVAPTPKDVIWDACN